MTRFILINLCLLTLLSPTTHARDYELFLLTENYPPFNMSIQEKNFSRASGIDGIAADIVKEMMKRSGIKYSMTLRSPWSRIYKLALNSPNYGLFSTTRTIDREALFQWVGPLVSNDWVAFVKRGRNVTINSLQDLKRYKVGGYEGDAATDFLEKNGVRVEKAALDRDNPEKLANGQIDVWVSGAISGRYIAEAQGFPQIRSAYTVKSTEMYLALNLDVPAEKVLLIQSALDQMRADGKVRELTNNYQ